MDISNIRASLGASKSPETVVTAILQQFSSSRTARVLEIVPLSKTETENLLLKQVLSESLNNQLAAHLNRLKTNGSIGETISLVKLQPDVPNGKTFWALTSIVLQPKMHVGLSRFGDVLLLSPNAAAHNAPSSPAAVSSGSSNNSSLATTITAASKTVVLTSPVSQNASKLIEHTHAGSTSSHSGLVNQSLTLDSKAIATLLNQILKLSLPIQDKKASFLSEFQASATKYGSDILNLAAKTKQADLKELGALITRLQTWAVSIPKMASLTVQDVQGAIETLTLKPKPEGITSAGSASQNKNLSNRPEIEDIKTILESVLPLLRRLETTSASFSRADSQLFGALIRLFLNLYPNKFKSQGFESNEKISNAIRQLEQLAVGTIAKQITAQARSVLQSVFTESAPGVQLEGQLLLRHNELVLPVNMFIREARQSESGNKRKDRKKHSTWNVFLEWEIDGHGAYHTEIKVRDNTVSATIWAEKNHIRHKFKDKISKLREVLSSNGVDVESLVCSDIPLTAPSSVQNHTLIDVRT